MSKFGTAMVGYCEIVNFLVVSELLDRLFLNFINWELRRLYFCCQIMNRFILEVDTLDLLDQGPTGW